MEILAVVDATNSRAPQGPATEVAGLSLLERTLRLADVCGADEIVVYTHGRSCLPSFDIDGIDASVHLLTPGEPLPQALNPEITVLLDAETVFDRAFVQRAVQDFEGAAPTTAVRTADGHLAMLRLTPDTPHPTLQKTLELRTKGRPRLSGGWTIPVDSHEAIQRAERRLWNSCRKPEDGLVARYFNRHISLAISRRLAPTSIQPDHITALTFLLGIAAALGAAHGEYVGFFVAGILYQLNSIIDGVDGELARVRYEFSVRGEWLDTLSDDLADLLIYVGIGVGAWRTLSDAPGPFDTTIWLVLSAVAAGAKLTTMALYYRWLRKHGRGDLLAFQWSFEHADASKSTPSSQLLRLGRYIFRKDFIVFAALIMSVGGVLPYLLFALAPGNVIVAVGVLIQQMHSAGRQ